MPEAADVFRKRTLSVQKIGAQEPSPKRMLCFASSEGVMLLLHTQQNGIGRNAKHKHAQQLPKFGAAGSQQQALHVFFLHFAHMVPMSPRLITFSVLKFRVG